MPEVKAEDPDDSEDFRAKRAPKAKDGRPTRRNALDLANYQTTKLKMKQYEDIHNAVEQRMTQESAEGQSKGHRENSQGGETIPTEQTDDENNESLSSCELLELERKRQFMKAGRAHALMIQSSNTTPGGNSQQESEKTDEVTGLKVHRYLLEVDFIEVQKFILRLQRAREENDIIGTTVNEIAEECKIEPSQIYDRLKNFILRKEAYLKEK